MRCDLRLGYWQYVAAAVLACSQTTAAWAQARNLAPVGSPNPVRVGASTDDAPQALATGDLNGDGKLDLVTANVGSSTVSVLLGNGDGTFKAEVQYAVGTGPRAVAVADVNGDGKADLVTANGNGGNVSVLLGKGDGTFLPAVQYSTDAGSVAVAVGDVNGDGIPDLVTANTSTPVNGSLTASSLSVLLGHQDSGSMTPKGDGTFVGPFNRATPPAPSSLALADFDGDGVLDVVTANLGKVGAAVTDTFSFFKGNGDGSFQNPANFAGGFLGPRSLVAADLNGDGRLDLVVTYPGGRLSAGSPPGLVSVMLGNGNGTFQAPVNNSVPEAPIAVAVGDFDQDGRPDLVSVNLGPRDSTGIPIASTAALLLGNADGTFAPAQFFPLPKPPQSLVLASFNGDGYPDLIAGIATQSLGSETPPSIHLSDARVYAAMNVPDSAPVAACKNLTLNTGPNACTANATAAQVDNGSSDPDFGDTLTLSLSPAGPYNLGPHMVTLTVTDNHGLSSTCPATITVVDTTAPVVTLNGAATVKVECHTSFDDPGATATDNCDPSVTVSTSGTVDVNTPGTYIVTYSAMDSSGNPGSAMRTVIVQDTIPPVITLNGSKTIKVECHSSFTDPGATASDTCAGTVPVNSSGTVDVNTPGTYTLTYTASDGYNTATEKRTVTVQDTLPPVVTLNGPAEVTVECHGTFIDPGATAIDACAGAQLVNIGGTVNTNVTGDYTVTYIATDPSGNQGTATRIVHVVDTTPPTISNVSTSLTMLSPANHKLLPVTVNYTTADLCGGVRSWLTVTSSEPDNGTNGGDIPNDIQIVDEHHLSLRAERSGKARTYTITIHASDGANEATTTVTVSVK